MSELKFTPRPYQVDFLDAMMYEVDRAVLCWHRRAGKEIACWNLMIFKALHDRVGTYLYYFPTSKLGRRILWDGANKDGKRFLDYIPQSCIKGQPNSVEMKIELTNGSVIQIMGTDHIINVGINPVGCVFSEFSLQDPKAWELTRPILRENGGWAVFNFTPRGKNWAYDLLKMAEQQKNWFSQVLTVRDTNVLTDEDLQQELAEGMSQDLIEQEYLCSFDLGADGSYYAKYLNKAELDERIGNVAHDPRELVHTAWDLGISDSTAIIFFQQMGKEIHIIDYYEAEGEGLDHYARVLRDRDYLYGKHWAPHDIEVRELSAGGISRKQVAAKMGIKFSVVPRHSIMDGIEAVRATFPRMWINRPNCAHFLKCIEAYHKRYNEALNVYSDTPVHNWASHCFTGDTEILTRNGMCQIMDLPKFGEILTLEGWKKYKNPRVTRKDARLVEVSFADGIKVKCTPDHLFMTEKGWKYAKNLTTGTKIQSSLMKAHNTSMENFTGYGQTKNIFLREAKNCIAWFGKALMEQFQKGVTFITKMMTQQTIVWKTLNAWMLQSTLVYLGPKKPVKEKSTSHRNAEKKQLTGIDLKLGEFGIADMLNAPNPGQNGKESRPIAFNAEKSFKNSFGQMDIRRNFAIPTAKLPTIEDVRELNETSDVWCLTVPDIEHFSLSNGAIVHNCADALRYLCVAVKLGKTDDFRMSEEEANMMEDMYRFK